jgi:hypothetical protein
VEALESPSNNPLCASKSDITVPFSGFAGSRRCSLLQNMTKLRRTIQIQLTPKMGSVFLCQHTDRQRTSNHPSKSCLVITVFDCFGGLRGVKRGTSSCVVRGGAMGTPDPASYFGSASSHPLIYMPFLHCMSSSVL